VEVELRADDDDRAAGIVDALAEQVLAETPLLAAQHVGETLEGAVAVAAHGRGFAAVVEKRIDRLLEHAFLVAQDHFGGLDLEQLFQTVVADDHAAVEIIEIRGREAAALEGNQGAQFGRHHRDDRHDHPVRTVFAVAVGAAESLHHLEALESIGLALNRGLAARHVAQLVRKGVDIDVAQQRVNGRAADLGVETMLFGQVVLRVAHALDEVEIVILSDQLPRGEAAVTRADHHIGLVIDHLLQLLDAHAEDVADLGGEGFPVPDVDHGHSQGDMAHAFAADALHGHLDAAAVADDAFVADALVFAAVAFPVAHRSKDLFAEKAVLLGLEGAIVDGLRLGHLAVRTFKDLVRRGKTDVDGLKIGILYGMFLSEHVIQMVTSKLCERAWLRKTHKEARRISCLACIRRTSDILRGQPMRAGYFFPGLLINSTSRPRPINSRIKTLNDSGRPGSGMLSPLTMAS